MVTMDEASSENEDKSKDSEETVDETRDKNKGNTKLVYCADYSIHWKSLWDRFQKILERSHWVSSLSLSLNVSTPMPRFDTSITSDQLVSDHWNLLWYQNCKARWFLYSKYNHKKEIAKKDNPKLVYCSIIQSIVRITEQYCNKAW